MSDPLVVGLEAWIIHDGNYRDFACGRRAAFALEFHPLSALRQAETGTAAECSLTRIGDASYDALGQVVHVADGWWVMDFGILAFQDQKPPENVRTGDWLYGQLGLGIDPYFYFEMRYREPHAPALIYDWDIEKIEMQTAPFIQTRPRQFERDVTRLGWKEIAETAAFDGVLACYLLHCRRVDALPRHALTAI